MLTAVEDGDEAVGIKPIKDGDRATWRAAMTMGGKLIDVVVDQQTGIVTWYSDGEDTFTATVDWDVAAAGRHDLQRRRAGGHRGGDDRRHGPAYEESPAAAGRTAGYAPLVSDLAPDGYGLKAVATVARRASPRELDQRQGVGTCRSACAGPRSSAAVHARPLAVHASNRSGPPRCASAAGVRGLGERGRRPASSRFRQTTLQYGALKGATAFTWYQESGPSLFASGARRAVFVTGALTRQELIAFAEGLKPAATGE